ncbi:MAG: phosphoribosylanthranilate isomerase, partial [Rickettsiales bacterium]|nr:phosphoribosylanthranilate isomerase [Rickettsiales bacterium]
MSVQAKLCGLTSAAAVEASVKAGSAYAGFVFFDKSPRNVTPVQAAKLAADIPQEIQTVAVLVNPQDEVLDMLLQTFRPAFLQLHGDESPERVNTIRKQTGAKIIKALKVHAADDVARAGAYSAVADMLLFDAKAPEAALPGGNGLAFDWALLRHREFALPWFLSGGLHAGNVAEAVQKTGA